MKKLMLLLIVPIFMFCQDLNSQYCDENTISILTNPSFENDSFSCWESNGTTTILESEYDDNFSVQVIGNYYVQQTFNPIPVSSLSNATVMAYRPEESPMSVWWDYSNGTSGSTYFSELNPGWNTVDILSELDQNLELITITFWGYSGAGSEEDVTIFDAFNFCSDVENYEPLCSTIFGCTDDEANNFDPEATEDDGSCSYFSCEGITNSLNISTGYSEEIETQISYTSPANNDPQWVWVVDENTTTPSVVYLGAPAYDCGDSDPTTDIIDNYPTLDIEEACEYAAWISPYETTSTASNISYTYNGVDPAIIDYENSDPYILEIEFCLLEEDNLWFNGDLSADNYAEIYFNETLIGALSTCCPGGQPFPNSNYYNVTPIDYFLENIPAGTHKIQIHLYNIGGPLGAKLEGFITSESNNENLCFECEEEPGCIDQTACNYNPTATLDDGSCFYCSSREFYDGDYMDVDADFNSAKGVTISLWVNDDNYFDNPTDFSTYIDFGSPDNYRYMIRNRSGKIEAFFEGDAIPEDPMGQGMSVDWSYPFASTAGTLPTPFDQTYTNPVGGDFDSGWHQITVVYCATGVRVYIDGEIEAQGVTSVFFDEFNLESQDIKRIGLNQFGQDPADAMIDEVRLWNRALSEYEIEQRYLNADPLILDITNELVQTDGAGGTLVGYWMMDCESPFLNEITNVISTNYGTIYNEQFGGYNTCDAYVYDYACVSDCNSCDPPEGCMDGGNTEDGDGIEACNYDPLAVVSVPQNCFYVPDYCPGLEQEYYDCECKCLNDTDLDEVCDEEDNCVGVYNPNQEDLNGDGIGDDCDGIGLEQNFVDKKKLIKITDVLGREIQKETKETILMYWYNTGEVKMEYKL